MRAEDTELLGRCLRFELDLDRDAATRFERFAWGTAVLDERVPLVWDASYITIEWPGMSAEEVGAVADEVLGGAGLAHRQVVVLDALEDERLAPGMENLGYEIIRDLYMVRRREPDRPAEIEVHEAPFEEVAGLRRRLLTDGHGPGTAVPTVAQLLERDRYLGEAGGDRWFVASYEGTPAAACRLYQRDGIGQVEDVNTLAAARGRGLARAIVLAASEASRRDGDELTWICAAARDWPQMLYHRLGYEPIGEIAYFQRRPG